MSLENMMTKVFFLVLCIDLATNLLVHKEKATPKPPQQVKEAEVQQTVEQQQPVDSVKEEEEDIYNENRNTHGIPYIITIQYCNRSSLHGMYENLKRTIYMKFPNKNIEMDGLNYPIPAEREMLSKVVTYAQYGVMGLSFFYKQAFGLLGVPVPAVVERVAEKKMIIVMGVFLLGGQLNNYLMASGGFAVLLDGDKIYESFGGQVDFEQVLKELLVRIQ